MIPQPKQTNIKCSEMDYVAAVQRAGVFSGSLGGETYKILISPKYNAPGNKLKKGPSPKKSLKSRPKHQAGGFKKLIFPNMGQFITNVS